MTRNTQNYYDILGVPITSTKLQIDTAYKFLKPTAKSVEDRMVLDQVHYFLTERRSEYDAMLALDSQPPLITKITFEGDEEIDGVTQEPEILRRITTGSKPKETHWGVCFVYGFMAVNIIITIFAMF